MAPTKIPALQNSTVRDSVMPQGKDDLAVLALAALASSSPNMAVSTTGGQEQSNLPQPSATSPMAQYDVPFPLYSYLSHVPSTTLVNPALMLPIGATTMFQNVSGPLLRFTSTAASVTSTATTARTGATSASTSPSSPSSPTSPLASHQSPMLLSNHGNFMVDGNAPAANSTACGQPTLMSAIKPSSPTSPTSMMTISQVESATTKPHFACTFPGCDRVMTSKFSLKRHLRRHSDNKAFPCTVCKRKFSDSTALRRHKRIHTGEKPYRCRWHGCGKSFSDGSNVKRHEATHVKKGAQPFRCFAPDCVSRFSRRASLKLHLLTIHKYGRDDRIVYECLSQKPCPSDEGFLDTSLPLLRPADDTTA